MYSKKNINKKSEDISKWYLDIVREADLAENAPVRGCIIFKPRGYAIWERYQEVLNGMFKKEGVSNVYFPLFIPKSFFEKEAKHVEGFAKESAVVTHYRIKNVNGKLVPDPESKLEEELIVRPTSEAIIHTTFAKWIESYRDLPIKVNQWANIVRWEMRPRPFLRTTEFLWQEGHNVFATEEEAIADSERMIEVYREFAEEYLAIPVIVGKKGENEKFAGAEFTYTIEAMMPDGKALQSGTSHHLGKGFSEAFDVKYQNEENESQYAWMTSWGLSTRMIGALIMVHGDDNGLVLPPKIAPEQVIIVPISESNEQYAMEVSELLVKAGFRVGIDKKYSDTVGNRLNRIEVEGSPMRIEIGDKEFESKTVTLSRRDTLEKESVGLDSLIEKVSSLSEEIQKTLYEKALKYREENISEAKDFDEFEKLIKEGKFVKACWDGTAETEEKIKEKTKATVRILLGEEVDGACVLTGETAKLKGIFARSY
jgi:prolyl-tRNA synthetase